MTPEYKVVEIFTSIDGEGKRAGYVASFIRLAGCNLKCSYCDTKYAWDSTRTPVEYTVMTAAEILSALNPDIRNITLTGGEPLIAKNVKLLIEKLVAEGYDVNIETNGAVRIADFREVVTGGSFFTIDYKLPSSGMERYMIEENFHSLTPDDVLKFVVGSEVDIRPMTDLIGRLENVLCEKMPQIYIGVVWNDFDASKIVEMMIENPLLRNARLQLQMHKFIWNPEQRGV